MDTSELLAEAVRLLRVMQAHVIELCQSNGIPEPEASIKAADRLYSELDAQNSEEAKGEGSLVAEWGATAGVATGLAAEWQGALANLMDFRHTTDGMVRGGPYVERSAVFEVLGEMAAHCEPSPDVPEGYALVKVRDDDHRQQLIADAMALPAQAVPVAWREQVSSLILAAHNVCLQPQSATFIRMLGEKYRAVAAMVEDAEAASAASAEEVIDSLGQHDAAVRLVERLGYSWVGGSWSAPATPTKPAGCMG